MRAASLSLLLLLAVAACGGERAYRVGVAAGPLVYDAADLATKEVNATGRIDGRPLRLTKGDTLDKSTGAERAARLARGFAADTAVRAVVQKTDAEGLEAAARIYESGALPALVLGPALAPSGRWVFHLLPRAEDEAELLATQARRIWAPKRAVIVHSPDLYGRRMAALVRERIGDVEVPLDTAYPAGADTAGLGALAKRIADAKPNVVFWLGDSRPLGEIFAQLRNDIPDLRVLGSDAVEAARVHTNDGCNFCGLVFARAVDPAADTAKYANFQYRFTVWMGRPTTSDAVLAYDAVGLLAQALRAGARSREQLREYLMSLGRSRPAYPGYGGPIAFDSAGVATRKLQLAEVTGQGIVPVPAPPVAAK
ncbi:MAG: ABC transporter substrate-binding protein [Gemmatimonadetes bacterium]|nr:ABC transporter substrate-binding protein [Gemmatimonadota bacterium]